MSSSDSRLLGRALRLTALPSRWAVPRGTPLRLRRYGADAVIVRDARGIPWLTAGSERDLYFAAGFAQACDRLWQMDLLRRRALGRLSEIFGSATVEADVRVRRLAFARLARESEAVLSEPGRAALDGFSDGVNAAARRLARRAGLPPEFLLLRYRPEPWTPLDSIAIVKLLGFDLGKNLLNEVYRAGLARFHPECEAAFAEPKYPAHVPVTVRGKGSVAGPDHRRPDPQPATAAVAAAEGTPPGDSVHLDALPPASRALLDGLLRGEDGTTGSNAWVLAGSRTASGRPLLANDPHVAFSLPNLWYQLGLRLTGGDHEPEGYGVTVPGLPGLVVGANRDVAFGITNATVDTQDLCRLPPDTQLPGRWAERTQVRVRGADPVAVEAAGAPGWVEYVLPEVAGGERCGLFWSGFAPTAEIDGCLGMWRSLSYAEFRDALRHFGVPVLNFAVACQDGTIALKTAGRIPRREQGSGRAPAEYEQVARSWREFLDFDELPEVVDPPDGYIFNANNKLLPDDSPIHLTADWAGAYRAPRIEELVRDSAGVTPSDCARWQMDTVNVRARRLLPVLLVAIDREPPAEAPIAQCLELLRDWDCTDAPEAGAPLVFAALMDELTEDWVGTRLGRELTAVMPDQVLQIDHLVLEPAARAALGVPGPLEHSAVPALARAAQRLARDLGGDPSRWRNDAAHPIDDAHPLAGSVAALRPLFGLPATPTGASPFSVRLMTPNSSGTLVEGAPWRFVAEPGATGAMVWDVLRHGSSGHPLSAHYDDQAAAHTAGQLYEVSFGFEPHTGPPPPAPPRLPRAANDSRSAES
jgi:penicillin amidase